MKPDEWWKNFALGLELDISGTFIYNGLKRFHELESLDNTADIFETLYGLSVGVERLLKVAIVLVEHEGQADVAALEESLITHSTAELANRLDAKRPLSLPDMHREFLALLSKFYKTYRYERFSLASVPNIESEKRAFHDFICKHLAITPPPADGLLALQNTDQVRRFLGRLAGRITSAVFEIIRARARELNIYTYELRSESKAHKIFSESRLDFIDEDLKKRELLLFLMHPTAAGKHIELIRSFDPLGLDPALAPDYVRALLNDVSLPFVGDEIDELYTEVADPKARFELLRVMDYDSLFWDEDEGEQMDDSVPVQGPNL